MTPNTKHQIVVWTKRLPTISLYLRKDKRNRKGECGIYLKLSSQGKPKALSMARHIDKKFWTGEHGKWIHKKHPLADDLNIYLEEQLTKVNKIIYQRINEVGQISYEEFKALFQGKSLPEKAQQNDTLLWKNFHEVFIKEMTEKVCKKRLQHFASYFNKLLRYAPNLAINEINPAFLDGFRLHLYKEYGNNINTASKNLSYIRQVLNTASRKDLISYKQNPFRQGYQLKWKRTKPVFLNFEELENLHKLYEAGTLDGKYQNVLQYFLFSANTGMDYGDIKSFQYQQIEQFQGQYIVNRARQKEDENYITFINERAQKLIPKLDDFEKMPKSQRQELVFRVISNQKTNEYLKAIMTKANIHKHITFHKARHTFATLSHALGINKKLIQQAMGHSDSRMTDVYTHVVLSSLLNDFKKWNTTTNQNT